MATASPRVALRRRRLVALSALLVAASAFADDWPAARPRAVFSQSRERFVEITPGKRGDGGGFARALSYERQPDRSYRVVADVALLNPIAPVDLLLSDSGSLITFDNWHEAGYGRVVAIYDPAGRPVASWALEDLYSQEELSEITASVSSRWWRCAPFHFVDLVEQTRVYVRETFGGYFVFDLRTGTFVRHPGSAACQPPGGAQGSRQSMRGASSSRFFLSQE